MTVTRENSDMQSTSTLERRQRMAAALTAKGIAQRVAGRSPELTDNAKVVLDRRYLSKDREGNILEDPDGMFRRVALNLSQAELNYGASEAERQAVEEDFYQVMRHLELLPNFPYADERGPGSSTALPPVSCFR